MLFFLYFYVLSFTGNTYNSGTFLFSMFCHAGAAEGWPRHGRGVAEARMWRGGGTVEARRRRGGGAEEALRQHPYKII